MKYYKHNSIPLEIVENIGIGERAFDQYGNYIEINAFGEPEIVIPTELNDGEKLDEYKNQFFLKAYWATINKKIYKNEI